MHSRKSFEKSIRIYSDNILNSIALFPAVIAFSFLFLSWSMIELDASTFGKHFKESLSWLRLQDANTARTIVSTITSGIISLTVFSFSLVMIVLTQAASQMSNRTLTSMIENRFQQFVLGFYIGSIVYSLFLLASIRDIDTGVYVPAISIYLLIFFTVVDIFLFIYFLDYVTHTVKYETVISRLEKHSIHSMKTNFCLSAEEWVPIQVPEMVILYTQQSGYFQGIATNQLIRALDKQQVQLSFQERIGAYLVKGTRLAVIHGKGKITPGFVEDIWRFIDFYDGQPIKRNPEFGFSQLAEVALKALSPGINDPATAVLSLHALSNLFMLRLDYQKQSVYRNQSKEVVIVLETNSFQDLFVHCVFPIWHYGKNDQYVQDAIICMVTQLTNINTSDGIDRFLQDILEKAQRQKMKSGNPLFVDLPTE